MMRKRGNLKFYEGFSWYVPGVGGLFVLAVMFVLGAVIGNLVAMLVAGALKDFGSEYVSFIAYPIMFIPPMMYARIKSRNASLGQQGLRLNSANFGGYSSLLLALLAAFATWAAAFCVDAPVSLMPPMPEWLESALKSMTQGNVWINFICVSIFAPFFEEWLCRGMVLRGLLGTKMRPVWAIVISAVFFAVIHANPWQAIPAFVLGCLFGYVYYKTGSLLLTMIMHFANNTLSLALSQIDSLKDCKSFMEVFPDYYWIIFAACAVLLVLIVKVFRSIPLKSPEGNIDRVGSLFDE